MKNLIAAIAVLVTGLVSAQKATLEIEMKGFKNNDGVVNVGLYNSEGKFLKTAYKGKKSDLKNKKANVIFEGLEKGEYAVVIYQDENRNGKLDKNFMGIPTEDYMASNDSKGFMGPPKYTNAKFLVSNNSKIVININ